MEERREETDVGKANGTYVCGRKKDLDRRKKFLPLRLKGSLGIVMS